MEKVHHYTAYGLRIESAFELPELSGRTADSDADLTYLRGHVHRDMPSTLIAAQEPSRDIGIGYRGIGRFLVSDGKRVTVDLESDVDPRILRLILLGPILGIVLHQRGFLVLHASAIRIGDRAVAFIGAKGAGKSTTAAALTANGHLLLADDVVAVSPADFVVYPAFPQLKLWPSAAAHLAGSAGSTHLVHPDLDKIGLRVADKFSDRALPLARVFALCDGPAFAIERLSPQAALMQLVGHSYALELLQLSGSSSLHFKQAVALAAHVPVCRLTRPRILGRISELIDAVVANAA